MLALLFTTLLVLAGDPGDGGDTSAVQRLEIQPALIELQSSRSRSQLIVTAIYRDGRKRDLTHTAHYVSSNQDVVGIDGAIAIPKENGTATVRVEALGLQAISQVHVSGMTLPDPVRFHHETLAILTRQGCNAGSCHGAPEGKNGFALSLFAYAPDLDFEALVRGGLNRRINTVEPEESLLLKKPTLRVAHQGGKRLSRSDEAYRLLRDWIAEGAHTAPDTETACTSIVIAPAAARVLYAPDWTQQLAVTAHFRDGSVRDVTNLATFSSSHPGVVSVNAAGLATGRERGQAAVSIRYLDKLESVHFTVVEVRPGFQWTNVAQNNYVDELVDAKLRLLQVQPSESCNDAVFLRRLHLDLTGLLPEPEEARRFLEDRSADKRRRLLERLLDSPEFARFWALRTADLLRVNPQTLKDGRAELFARWLFDSFRDNMPYDQFVTFLLTAAGDTRSSAPANYFQALANNDDLTEATAQIFMGSRVNCARCHNHPFENWTQNDYYRLTAVFARVKRQAGRIMLATNGETKHPATSRVMRPWGSEPETTGPAEKADRREKFASWLTKKGNPYFARVEANRIWAHLLGRGIVHPVDDFRSSNPSANVELLDALARDFEESGFDRKHLIRVICMSRTYQRSTAVNRFNEDDEQLFSHAPIRRLMAEQIQDAVGYVTHSLPPARLLDLRTAQARLDLEAELDKLVTSQADWEKTTRANLLGEPCWAGAWSMMGPFAAESREKGHAATYPPELGPVDLQASFEKGRLKWIRHGEWEDGQNHPLPPTTSFMYRLLHAKKPSSVVLTLTSQQCIKVWLNGKLIFDKKDANSTNAGAADRIPLELRSGANQLLVKISSFFFGGFSCGLERDTGTMLGLHLSGDVTEILAADKAPTADQHRLLEQFVRDASPVVKSLRTKIARGEGRLDYATQRIVPEPSEFLQAFGQPKRESACACERSSDPTIDQELQLLNGKQVHDQVEAAAEIYFRMKDDALTEALYLAAFSRMPTGDEIQKVKRHLRRSGNRRDAVRDLIWVIVNTQEFLFQH